MHPKERERKVTTVALAALALQRCDVLVGRDLAPFRGTCPALDAALGGGHAGAGTTCVLFPGNDAVDLSDASACDDASDGARDNGASGNASGNASANPRNDASDVAASASAARPAWGPADAGASSTSPSSSSSSLSPASASSALPPCQYLIVFDGTWRYAREMFEKNRPHLQGCTQVRLRTPTRGSAAPNARFLRVFSVRELGGFLRVRGLYCF